MNYLGKLAETVKELRNILAFKFGPSINFFEMGIPRTKVIDIVKSVPLSGGYRITDDTLFLENRKDESAVKSQLMTARKAVHTPRYRYTDEEFLEADIADLEVDYRCAIRDNQPEYAEKVKKELEDKRSELEQLRKSGRMNKRSQLGLTVGEVLSEHLEPNKWKNFGDVNYFEYGGVQLNWDGDDTIEYVDYATPSSSDAWYVSKGSIDIDDLVTMANAKELREKFGSTPNWPINKMEFTDEAVATMRYGGSEDWEKDVDSESEGFIQLILSIPSYGGYSTSEDVVTPEEIAENMTKKFGVEIDADRVKKDIFTNEQFEAFEEKGIDPIDFVHNYIKEKLLPKDLEV